VSAASARPSGVLVTLEGGEGAGKSTLAVTLGARARAAGREVVACREPGGTALGERLRTALLGATAGEAEAPAPVPAAELLVFAAARAQLVAEVLRPALARGALVVCDRYADSTTAYQSYGRGLDAALVAAVNEAATGGLAPELTLLLDLPPAEGLARRGARGDYVERERLAFHERVRAGYRALAAAEPDRWLVLDARQAPEVLAERAWGRLAPLLTASTAAT
jgi:dTMP kinase